MMMHISVCTLTHEFLRITTESLLLIVLLKGMCEMLVHLGARLVLLSAFFKICYENCFLIYIHTCLFFALFVLS